MKKIKYLLLFFFVGLLSACQEDQKFELSSDQYFVWFQEASYQAAETKIINIPVVLTATGPATTVSYAFEEIPTDSLPDATTTSAVLGVDYDAVDAQGNIITNYTLSFSNGCGVDTIRIKPVAKGLIGMRMAKVRLVGNSQNYKLGTVSEDNDNCNFAFFKEPLVTDFVGTYNTTDVRYNNAGIINTSITMSAGTNDTLWIDNLEKIAGVTTANPVKFPIILDFNTMKFSILVGTPIASGSINLPSGSTLCYIVPESFSDPINIINGTIDYANRTLKIPIASPMAWWFYLYKAPSGEDTGYFFRGFVSSTWVKQP